MNFKKTSVIIASAVIFVNGFSPSSFVPSCRRSHSFGEWVTQHVSLTVIKSSAKDEYTSLLEKLSETSKSQNLYAASSPPAFSSPSTELGNVNTLDTFVNAISSTFEAVNNPVATSENALKIPLRVLPERTEISSFINIDAVKPEALSTVMADAQTKLSVLQQQRKDTATLHDDINGFDLTQLSAALSKTLDVSIHAAEQAAESSLAVVAGPFKTETISHIIGQTHAKFSALEQQLHETRKPTSVNTELDPTQLLTALNEAIDASLDAAEKAAEASLAVVAGSVDTEAISRIISQTQSELLGLEQQLHDIRTGTPVSNDVDLTQLYAALNEARDLSSNIAKYASTSSSAVTDALVEFNVALGHTMSNIDLRVAMPPEIDDLIRRQTAVVVDGAAHDLEDVVMNWNHAWLQRIMNGFYREFSDFSLDNAFSSDTSVVMAIYGLMAFMLGYSQNMGAAQEAKYSLEEKSPKNTGDMTTNALNYDATKKLACQSSSAVVPDDLATESIALQESTTVKRCSLSSVDYDAAARLAYKESGLNVDFHVFKSVYLAEAAAMVAKKNPYVKRASNLALHEQNSLELVDHNAAPMLAYKASGKSTSNSSNPPLVSPLARNLAEEMGLELASVGAGSGKNGKILVEDVRNFKAKMEQAKEATPQGTPLFCAADV